jgi:16S rRNA (cytidine1402-2'-O)-methyltransferase
MAGTLFVVATPIGNLEDVTFRALRILREVRLIAAEDTRRTAKLLAHYEIRTSVVSLREHNEVRETPRVLARLEAGENVALVSDAGTPVVSDPGARLVRAARDRHLRVVPIPGPSAVVTALSASGFPADQFVFAGYPPSSGEDRQRWMEALQREARVVVFFESPHRIRRTLDDLATWLGERQILARIDQDQRRIG